MRSEDFEKNEFELSKVEKPTKRKKNKPFETTNHKNLKMFG
jgi:hypothetical protein